MLHGCRQCHSLHKNKINLIDIAKDVTSNYELGRPLPKGRNRKVTGSRKDDLGEKKIKLLHSE